MEFHLKACKKTIDNLKSDPYFDGDEVQIKLHKAIALPKKTTISFKRNILKS
jgi:RNA polymerase sigma-70 factor (ECF subfamily)